MSEKKPDSLNEEWENRILCSDESCVGTIGKDGRCRVCGLDYDGEPPSSDLFSQEPADDIMDDDPWQADDFTAAQDDTDDPDTAGTSDDADDDWDRRILCSDESCIGTIGPDNRCRECGKPYKP